MPFHRKVAELADRYTAHDRKLADIGSGTGTTLSLIAHRRSDIRLTAVDIDRTFLDHVAERVNGVDTLRVNSVEDLFETSQRFDTVVMSHVLEHTHRPLDVVRGVNGVLAEGGVAIYAVPNPHQPLVVAGALFRKDYVNRGHVYAWDRSHWINFLERIAGLDVVEHTEDYVPLKLSNSILAGLESRLTRLVPWMSRSHITVVRKTDLSEH